MICRGGLFLLLVSGFGSIPAFAQNAVTVSGVYSEDTGPLIGWEGDGNEQYEVHMSTNITDAAAWQIAPAGSGAMEESRPVAAGDGPMVYRYAGTSDVGKGMRCFRVRSGLSEDVLLTLVASEVVTSEGGLPAPETWHMQLVWSPDAVASPIDPDEPFYPTENEFVVFSQELNDHEALGDGSLFRREEFSRQSDVFVGGYYYVRVFDRNFVDGPAPTRYGQQPNIYGPVRRTNMFDPGSFNQMRVDPFVVDLPITPPQ